MSGAVAREKITRAKLAARACRGRSFQLVIRDFGEFRQVLQQADFQRTIGVHGNGQIAQEFPVCRRCNGCHLPAAAASRAARRAAPSRGRI